jgi:hypothetical protein
MNPLRHFDPLKWIDDLLCTLHNGGGVLLTFQIDTTWSGEDVERLLRTYGVKVYARVYADDDGHAGLHVRHAQAKYADGLLRGHGVNVTSPVLSKPIRPSTSWGAPAKAQGLAGMLLDDLQPAPRRERRTRNRRGTRNARR